MGRVVPRKRLDLFLDASRKLCDAGWNLSLDVIGGFPFARGLSSVLSEFPYPERLNYVAHREREQLPDVYRRATVLIQPSEEENFGSSVSEALACGTPVIVGPGNGTRDYVDAGGIMFDKYSSSSVAHALQMLLAGYDQREGDLRADARAAAERHFALDHVADGLESVLAEAIERATSQPRH
ncbi:MAG: glycosyltransferase [Solirubrobacteraceae bacterium]|nr:glycosyltransferase [Solirubrobacteraceae bacterium]